MFRAETLSIEGPVVLTPRVFADARGAFIKTYHTDLFREAGIPAFTLREEFFSVSQKDVLRGMHFQVPPHDHAKIVYCVAGAVLDVVVDIRRSSRTYGEHARVDLTADNRKILYIPKGFAHGFLSMADGTTMIYKTDAIYAPEHDTGIRWDRFGFTWPVAAPVVSERDRGVWRACGLRIPLRVRHGWAGRFAGDDGGMCSDCVAKEMDSNRPSSPHAECSIGAESLTCISTIPIRRLLKLDIWLSPAAP